MDNSWLEMCNNNISNGYYSNKLFNILKFNVKIIYIIHGYLLIIIISLIIILRVTNLRFFILINTTYKKLRSLESLHIHIYTKVSTAV